MLACRSFLILSLLLGSVSTVQAGDDALYVIDGDSRIDMTRSPLPGKALVFVIHPYQSAGVIPIALAKTSVFLDGELLGIMVGGMHGTFMVVDLEPGKHEFAATGENVSLLDADLAPDRIYLVQIGSRAGMIKARAFLGPVPPDSKAARRILKRTVCGDVREIRTTDAGRSWIAGHMPEILRSIESTRARKSDITQLGPDDGFAKPPWPQ